MEESFADLLTGAFSEASLPSFSNEELDFESFDDKFEDKTGGSHENITISTEEDGALHQEVTDQTRVLSGLDTSYINMAENDDKQHTDSKIDKEDFTGVQASVMNMDKIPEEDCKSSDGDPEQESSSSGEDEDSEEEDMGTGEKPQDWLMSVRCGDEFWDGNKEDRIFAQGQPLAPEGTENPQVRNEEQGESESDEDVYYFGRVPQRGGGTIIQGDGIEEEQRTEEKRLEDSSDTDSESMKIEKDEGNEGDSHTQYSPQEDEDPYRGEALRSIPEISMQNLQNLTAEDDIQDSADKMKDFSGDEHQEAGESFAEYPSDFSSSEFMEDGGKNQEGKNESKALPCASDTKQTAGLERGVTDGTWMADVVESDEKEDQVLDTGWTGTDVDTKAMDLNFAAGERDNWGETESGKLVLDDAAVKGCDDGPQTVEHMYLEAKDNTNTEEEEGQSGAKKSMPAFSQYQHTSEEDTPLGQPQSDNDMYSSSDDDIQMRRSDGEYTDVCHRDPENSERLEDALPSSESGAAFSRSSISDDPDVTKNYCSGADPAAFSFSWDTDVLTIGALLSEDLLPYTEEDKEETLPSYGGQFADERFSIDLRSVIQLGDDAPTVRPSNQGSVDDSFFFDGAYEGSRTTDLGEFGDDEYEDERNWEQEQERINAFYKFYNDSEEEEGKEERETKVQFCTDPLSQVIHYDTDSSDRDSMISSTDEAEDLSSTESSKDLMEAETLKINSALEPEHDPQPENVPDLSNTQVDTRKHKCPGILKLILRLGLVIPMGLLMYWWATDQLDWLKELLFFEG